MAKAAKPKRGPRKAARRSKVWTWVIVVAVVGLAGYGISQMSGIAYTDKDIRVVNFSGLDPAQKKAALQAANRARCTCGCGLGLAQCVSTDPVCPIRDSNIDLIKGMVKDAVNRPSSP